MMVDTHVYLSRWPFRRLRGDEPAELVRILRQRGITQGWAGSFDGLLHEDVSAVNARLAADCARYGADFLLPFGTVNPVLPDWQEDLRRCHQDHRMTGIRLHPNYHGYTLLDPVAVELLSAAAARGLTVQIVCVMEDERTQHPLLRVPNVDIAPLAGLARRIPELRLQLLNLRAMPRVEESGAWFDFAMQEGVGAVERLVRAVPSGRVVFGSCFPLLYLDAGLMKLKESALDAAGTRAIFQDNPLRLLGRAAAR
jgi:predicted TIM-barrel fold metal-dependent hydrolase